MAGELAVARARPRAALLAAALAFAGAAQAPAAMPSAAAPERVAAGGIATYAWVDTWGNAPWRLTAGRYGHAADIAVAPDGTAFVLDRRHQAVHVLAPDARARAVFRLAAPDDGRTWTARRIDAGPDGDVYVLSSAPDDGRYVSTVARLAPDGRVRARFGADLDYNDVAVGPDGRIYLTRAQSATAATPPPRERPPPTKGGVDVLDASGRRSATLDDRPLFFPVGVDVGPDGTVYVVNRLPNPGGSDPGPVPTPLPSWRPTGPRAPADAPAPVAGVVVYAADHAYRHTVPFNAADDVAAASDGAFVARNVEVFALGDTAALWAGPTGQVHAPGADAVLHLAAAPDGRLLASAAHCHAQGVLVFDPPVAPAAPRLVGALDRPELEGPAHPQRVAIAARGPVLLQGRFTRTWDAATGVWTYRTGTTTDQPQAVQRWSPAGAPTAQLGVCSGLATVWATDVSTAWWARDVAADGHDVYTVDPGLVERRPDDGFPAWTVMPATLDVAGAAAAGEASRLAAADADAGRVAVLDTGAGVVHVLSRDGGLSRRWTYHDDPGADAPGVPVDIALEGDTVFLADAGRGRVWVYALDGTPRGAWPVHDAPVALAAGPDGDVFVLGRRWGLRYDATGALGALWRLPDVAAVGLDIDVGDDGRVFVPWVDAVPAPEPTDPPLRVLRRAGIWVFAPVAALPMADVAPPPGACLALPDKTASPRVVPLGDTVEVRLAVAGRCPDRRGRAQVMLVVDTSRSMNGDSSLDRARDGVLALLGRVDPASTDVGLATFADDAVLEAPLGRDLPWIARRVAALAGWGDSRLAAGLDAARVELTGPRRDPDATALIVVATDGDYKGSIAAAVADVRAAGIAVHVLVFPGRGYARERAASLALVLGAPDAVVVDPDAAALAVLAARLGDARPEPGLFETVSVRDALPANMRYVPGSAAPPARYDPADHALTWVLGATDAATGVDLRYRLEPLAVGTWPTNVEATATYRDALGHAGRLTFPVPEVKVWDRASLTRRAFLPSATRGACLRPAVPLDVVLVLDASDSMNEPAGGGTTKLAAARSAAAGFIDLLTLGPDRAAVVAFNRVARSMTGLTADRASLAAGLAAVATSPGTRIDAGLEAAEALVAAQGRPGARAVVVVLTDGLQAGDVPAATVLDRADRLKAAGARVYPIGLGPTIDRDLMRAVASAPGDFLESPTTADLARAFSAVRDRLACLAP